MYPFTYPHTIDNGAGERLTFLRRVPGEKGDRLEVQNVVAPGVGPIMHVHRQQDEVLTVIDGRMGIQRLGQPEQFATAGQTAAFLAGDPHRFWNAGSTPLVCKGYIEPADNIEYFLGEIFRSTKRNGGHRPGLFDAAYLSRRYREEFGKLEVPELVQRVVFPAIVAMGQLFGQHRRFAGAPEPVRR